MEHTSIIDIVCRQTDYSKETAIQKLKLYDNDYQKVIKEFMGIPTEKTVSEPDNTSTSHKRYKIIRTEFDKACKDYRDKTEGTI